MSENGLPATFVPSYHDESAVKNMIYRPLGDLGIEVSYLSFGGFQLGEIYQTPLEDDGISAVREAIRMGINYIDTAPWYGFGNAEICLGKALKGIPRQAYYISTKVGRYQPEYLKMFDFSGKRTLQSVDISLKRLGLDYVDIIMIHDLEFAPNLDVILNETLPALCKVKAQGKARFIGITGYPLETLKTVVERSSIKIDTILSYTRCTLFDQSLQAYVPFFKENRVGIINAAPLGMGILTLIGPPRWHYAPEELKTACAKAAKYCKEKNVDISELALHYSLSQQCVDTHVIGIPGRSFLEKNLHTLQNGVTSHSAQVLQEINELFFKPLSVNHWEGKEVNKYWQKLQELQAFPECLATNGKE